MSATTDVVDIRNRRRRHGHVETHHLVAVGDQFAGQVTADEAADSSDECPHGGRRYQARCHPDLTLGACELASNDVGFYARG